MLETTREVKELLNDASNEGSDVQGRRHRRRRPRSMQCFRAEFTIPELLKPIHQGKAAQLASQLVAAAVRSPPWHHVTVLLATPSSRCCCPDAPLPSSRAAVLTTSLQPTTTSTGNSNTAPHSAVLPQWQHASRDRRPGILAPSSPSCPTTSTKPQPCQPRLPQGTHQSTSRCRTRAPHVPDGHAPRAQAKHHLHLHLASPHSQRHHTAAHAGQSGNTATGRRHPADRVPGPEEDMPHGATTRSGHYILKNILLSYRFCQVLPHRLLLF
jgi:hypothetical protein